MTKTSAPAVAESGRHSQGMDGYGKSQENIHVHLRLARSAVVAQCNMHISRRGRIRICAARAVSGSTCRPVIEMLARYRGLPAERGWDWGDDRIEMFRWARFAALGDVFAAAAPATGRRPCATWSAPTRRRASPWCGSTAGSASTADPRAGGRRGADAVGRGRGPVWTRPPCGWPARTSRWLGGRGGRRDRRRRRPARGDDRRCGVAVAPRSPLRAPAAAAGAALRAVVGHRRHRRRVVPRRRAAQVGRARAAVLPRRRRHAHGALHHAHRHVHAGTGVRASSSGRSPREAPGRGGEPPGASTRPRTAGTAATCTST